MNKVSRLVLIVYAAFFFSDVYASNEYFSVVNNSRWTIDIKATSNKYCVYYATPYEKRLVPDSHVIFMVAYNAAWFSKCSSHHSSQDFDMTFTLGHETYSTRFVWYKEVRSEGDLDLPAFSGALKVKVTSKYGTYFDRYGPILTIDND